VIDLVISNLVEEISDHLVEVLLSDSFLRLVCGVHIEDLLDTQLTVSDNFVNVSNHLSSVNFLESVNKLFVADRTS
jgi:hypothetical protein